MLGALAHPHRLQIVDALALGDASPGELMHTTGMTSSLLAHHVAALETAGALRRRRSDADARRSYLSLAWDEPIVAAVASHAAGSPDVAQLAPPSRRPPRELAGRIVFVCKGNSARSQLAAAIAAREGLNAASAGTAPAARIHPFALEVLERQGLAAFASQPRALNEVLTQGDIVVTVCDHAHATLGPASVALHWSMPSPASASQAAAASSRDYPAPAGPSPAAPHLEPFIRAFDDLEPRITRLGAALGAALHTTQSPAH